MRRAQLGFLSCILFLIFAASGYATDLYDYSNADSPYGSTRHKTGEWQKLGTNWDAEGSRTDTQAENDGLFWSINGSAWTNSSPVYVGDTITVMAEMWNSGSGAHAYNQVKVWADINTDGYFANETELVIAEKQTHVMNNYVSFMTEHTLLNTYGNDVVREDNPWTPWTNERKITSVGSLLTSQLVEIVISEDMLASGLWLRARVSCDHTIFADTNPYDQLWQGEVEDWNIEVLTRPVPPGPVPEPGTILLLGLGLIGFAATQRKRING